MAYYKRQYQKFLRPEKRISRSEIRPRNIYRIVTYKGGNPPNKQGAEARYVFVLGIVNKKIHCIKKDFKIFDDIVRNSGNINFEEKTKELFLLSRRKYGIC